MYTRLLSEISKKDLIEVGGKAASLGEMLKAGINVPPGFVVITKGFLEFHGKDPSPEFKKEILTAFKNLNAPLVAVRSSAIAEDSSASSWAGQLETFLNINEENLVDAIIKCWESLFSERAREYGKGQDLNPSQLKVAVIVQKMIQSEASGVIFTVNPVTKNENEIMIEAIFGLGELLVQGEVTPDNFLIDKNSLEIKGETTAKKEKMLVLSDAGNKEVAIDEAKGMNPSISHGELMKLTELAIKAEEHFGSPQDIEWAIENGEIFLLQSRPITTL